jgi:hypothetical protein
MDLEQLHWDGHVLLRNAIPADWMPGLRAAFDDGVMPSDQWPVPRSVSWRHALVDLDATVQAVCRLPALLAAAGALIGERFFISQAEGREPVSGGGHQALHRDLHAERPGDSVGALVFLDDYGIDNGATRIIPASHRTRPGEPPLECEDESRAVHLSGNAGDVLVFDVDLVHAGSRNTSGARRRSILIGYASEHLYASCLETASLRGVRMDTSECFDPSGRRSRSRVVRCPQG